MPALAAATIITIGDAGKGGWWYAIDNDRDFVDGFPTDRAAEAHAIARHPNYEIWYKCWTPARGRCPECYVMVPGPSAA